MKYMVLYFCQIFGLFLSNPLSGFAWPFVLPFPWHYVSWCVLNSHQPGQEVWCGPDLTMVGCKQFPKSWDFASTMGINLPWHSSVAPQWCKNVCIIIWGFFMTSEVCFIRFESLVVVFSYPFLCIHIPGKVWVFLFAPPSLSGKRKNCLLWSWALKNPRKYLEAVDKTVRAGKAGTPLFPSENNYFFF